MTIKELKTKKLTTRELLICQYAKEVILSLCENMRRNMEDESIGLLKRNLYTLECEAKMIGDDEEQLKNCLWLDQMLSP